MTEHLKYITFTGPMAHVYRKYVTTKFNYKKALGIILLFKKVNVIDTKEKNKMIIMLKVLHENQEDIVLVEDEEKSISAQVL